MKKRNIITKLPSSMSFILGVIVISCILTYIIPAGVFENIDGVFTLDDFKYVEQTPVSVFQIPLLIVNGIISNSAVITTYLVTGAAVYVITSSGAIQSLIGKLLGKKNLNRFTVVFGLTMFIALCNLVISPHAFVAFVPMFILLARGMGYDDLTGVGMILLGGAVTFSTGALGLTTLQAQQIVGLPLFSGIGYRLVCWIIFLIVTIIYIYLYAEKYRKSNLTQTCEGVETSEASQTPLDNKQKSVLVIFVATMLIIIIGSLKSDWAVNELIASFMVMGMLCGLILTRSFDKSVKLMVDGAKQMLSSAILAGVAGAVIQIINKGNIISTIIYYSTGFIANIPEFMHAPFLFLLQLFINCFVVSGGAQAVIMMPIVSPIATLLGIPQQSAVLGFNFGDGFGNYILPHSSQLVSYIERGDISYVKWVKYFGKLFIIWVILSMILVAFSVKIWA